MGKYLTTYKVSTQYLGVWVNIAHLRILCNSMQIIYTIVQHIHTPEVEILVQRFAAHNDVSIAAFTK